MSVCMFGAHCILTHYLPKYRVTNSFLTMPERQDRKYHGIRLGVLNSRHSIHYRKTGRTLQITCCHVLDWVDGWLDLSDLFTNNLSQPPDRVVLYHSFHLQTTTWPWQRARSCDRTLFNVESIVTCWMRDRVELVKFKTTRHWEK